jgi:hypothetical protein
MDGFKLTLPEEHGIIVAFNRSKLITDVLSKVFK